MSRRRLRILLSNIPFIILSLILALTIWVLANLMRPQTISIDLPIKFVNLPQHLVVKQISASNVKVQLSGKGSDFLRLLLHKPIYQLDLAMMRPGLNRIKLAPDELSIATPVLLKSTTPEYVEVLIDKLESKPVSVVVPYRPDTQKGFYITDITVLDTPILYGPEEDIPFIRQVVTESLLVSEFTPTEIIRKLKIISPKADYFKVIPESVTIRATLETEDTRLFVDVPINIILPIQHKVRLEPKTVQIAVRGPKSWIQKLQINDIKVQINLSKFTIGEYQEPAEIILPKGIFLVRCEPQIFNIKIY
ncbi:MAG: hypothetical protein N2201_02095 [candidate division WOR-3 bacterium]|nr:hypothetical protein [candidate division WOR-3 bacterium]